MAAAERAARWGQTRPICGARFRVSEVFVLVPEGDCEDRAVARHAGGPVHRDPNGAEDNKEECERLRDLETTTLKRNARGS